MSQSKESKEKSTSKELKSKAGHVIEDISQPPVQVSANASNGPFSSLPPEAMNLVLKKVNHDFDSLLATIR